MSLNRPWLSVVVPTYNGARYLNAAFASVAAQGHENLERIEILIVDDGSTDDTLPIIESWRRRLPLHLVASRRVGNWVRGTNDGLRASTGEFVSILHQDDLWEPARLSHLRRLCAIEPSIDVFVHQSFYVDAAGRRRGPWGHPGLARDAVVSRRRFLSRLLVQNFICIDAPIFRRNLLDSVGLMDEALWYATDWDFWLRIFGSHDSYFSSKRLTGFRLHPGAQTICRSSKTKELESQLLRTLDKHAASLGEPPEVTEEILQAARFSVGVNVALAQILHQSSSTLLLPLLASAMQLGPRSLVRYLRDSRLGERLVPRIHLLA